MIFRIVAFVVVVVEISFISSMLLLLFVSVAGAATFKARVLGAFAQRETKP